MRLDLRNTKPNRWITLKQARQEGSRVRLKVLREHPVNTSNQAIKQSAVR